GVRKHRRETRNGFPVCPTQMARCLVRLYKVEKSLSAMGQGPRLCNSPSLASVSCNDSPSHEGELAFKGVLCQCIGGAFLCNGWRFCATGGVSVQQVGCAFCTAI